MEKKRDLEGKVEWKKGLMVLLLVLVCDIAVYAQASGIAALDTWGDRILGILTSSWIQAICALGFAIEAGAMIYSGRQGESGVVKKFIPWMIGTVGLLSASAITDFFFSAA
jgi:hypothetical protein